MLKYINVFAFIISFSIGVFAVYVTVPDKKKIVVYPTPDNSNYVQYKDTAGNCFQFKETKTTCSPGKTKKTPIQS